MYSGDLPIFKDGVFFQSVSPLACDNLIDQLLGYVGAHMPAQFKTIPARRGNFSMDRSGCVG